MRSANPSRFKSPAALTDTPTAILEAAESLFVEMGFAGTSLRAISTRAGVNLASAHYHFGSKVGLLGAVIHRRVRPANEARGASLDALLRETPKPSVHQLLEVFFSPLASGGVAGPLPRLMARLYGDMLRASSREWLLGRCCGFEARFGF